MARNRQLKNARWLAFGLSVVGTLVLLAVIILGSILIGDTTNSGLSASYKILNGYLDLSYPNTTADITDSSNWTPSVPDSVKIDKTGFFVTDDTWQVARDFYTQKLQKAGLSVDDAYGCSQGECSDAVFFSVDIQPTDKPELHLAMPYHITFVIISSNASDAEFAKSTIPTSIRQSLKPNTTLIAFISASFGNSAIPANPTTSDPLATPAETQNGA